MSDSQQRENELLAARYVSTRMEWNHIETAPTDGTEVLVCRVYEGGSAAYAVARWDGGEWRDMGDIGWAGMHGDDGNQPTHWMPLPEPPNADITGLAPAQETTK